MRKASYQGGAYRAQLDLKKPAYPVVCMVLDWTGKNSRHPMSLKELLAEEGASDDELQLADEVKLTVYHMNHLSREIRSRFASDMGFVVDYLNEGGFEGRGRQKVIHAEALCNMMEALTGDARFTDLVSELKKKQEEGGDVFMCEYIDMLEARGEIKGENHLAQLIRILLNESKLDEVEQAISDSGRRKELYQLYGI